ncbi:MAG TPA: hypothetical protein PKN50_13260 [Spirochaetota bacterium]|jgi:predicted SprT family Zn-dependent metalloprotease|nr:hypothetical protein [Spirochaetota bacterium]HPV43198.1 hypothetical protein [Spirochaetota bacterium]
MKEVKLRSYAYRCSCGYEVKVFLDSGIPQETFTCRNCGSVIKRKEL